MKSQVIVVCSDQHCGSELGLAHPDGVTTPDGNTWKPGKALLHLWEQYSSFVNDTERLVRGWRTTGATAHLVLLGDLTDGDHHNTHQIVGRELGTHVGLARKALTDGVLRIGFDSVHMVMGTPAHVGPAGGLEKSVGKNLEDAGYPIVRSPGGATIWTELLADFGAYRFDFRHHGRASGREHLRRSYANLYAADIYMTAVAEGRRPPDVAVRAHNHKMADSGPDHRGWTRQITTGCWQYSSEWVKSRSIESRPDFGGWVFYVTEHMTGPYDLQVHPLKYHHPNAEVDVWRP